MLTYTHDNTHFIGNIYIYTWVKELDVGQAYCNPLPTVFMHVESCDKNDLQRNPASYRIVGKQLRTCISYT